MTRVPKILIATALLVSPVACRQIVIGAKDSGTPPGTAAQGSQPGSGGEGSAGGAAGGSGTAGGSAGAGGQTAALPAQFSVNVPKDNLLAGGLLYSMIDAFNAGVGRGALTIPVQKPTSNIKWVSGSDLGGAFCQGAPVDGGGQAFNLRLSSDDANKYVEDPLHMGDLKKSPVYLEFAHCVGQGMGLAASTDPADVMGPDPANATKLDAFYAQVKALKKR